MEKLDLYYENGKKSAEIITRGDEIPKGFYVGVAHVIVRHTDGDFLLMQRDLKKTFAGLWEAGASGAVISGESFFQGAKRELFEETGILSENIEFLESKSENQRIYKTFLCVTDIPKDSIVLQAGETIGYKWLSKDEFLEFVETSDFVYVQKPRMGKYLNILKSD